VTLYEGLDGGGQDTEEMERQRPRKPSQGGQTMNPELVNRSRANSLERMAHASLKDEKTEAEDEEEDQS